MIGLFYFFADAATSPQRKKIKKANQKKVNFYKLNLENMKNYSRKKSTAGKVAFTSPNSIRTIGALKARTAKAGCCSAGLKGKCSC